jgi:hypothetical protein
MLLGDANVGSWGMLHKPRSLGLGKSKAIHVVSTTLSLDQTDHNFPISGCFCKGRSDPRINSISDAQSVVLSVNEVL